MCSNNFRLLSQTDIEPLIASVHSLKISTQVASSTMSGHPLITKKKITENDSPKTKDIHKDIVVPKEEKYEFFK